MCNILQHGSNPIFKHLQAAIHRKNDMDISLTAISAMEQSVLCSHFLAVSTRTRSSSLVKVMS